MEYLKCWPFDDETYLFHLLIRLSLCYPKSVRKRTAMALHAFPRFPNVSTFLSPTRHVSSNPQSLTLNPSFHLHRSPPIKITASPESRRRRLLVAHVVEESQDSSEPESASSDQTLPESEEQQPPPSQPSAAAADKSVEHTDLASELKKAMEERKEKEADNLWSGVAAEIKEIEWPAFGKVLSTTGVVVSVILGSSVVLLTVNAVLAELSDRVFAGKGVQDFFS